MLPWPMSGQPGSFGFLKQGAEYLTSLHRSSYLKKIGIGIEKTHFHLPAAVPIQTVHTAPSHETVFVARLASSIVSICRILEAVVTIRTFGCPVTISHAFMMLHVVATDNGRTKN